MSGKTLSRYGLPVQDMGHLSEKVAATEGAMI